MVCVVVDIGVLLRVCARLPRLSETSQTGPALYAQNSIRQSGWIGECNAISADGVPATPPRCSPLRRSVDPMQCLIEFTRCHPAAFALLLKLRLLDSDDVDQYH